jgi:hypothetical protein
VALQRPPDATALPRRPRSKPPTIPGYKKVAAAPGTLAPSSLPLPGALLLSRLPPSDLQAAPWLPLSCTILRHPSLHRRAEKLRLVLLLFLAEGIKPERLESPSHRRFSRRS